MGYPPTDPEFEPADPLRQAVLDLDLELRPTGPPHRRTVLLTARGEHAWSGGVMILLSVSLLRTLLAVGRLFRRPQPKRRTRHRVDIRV
jgi:hypothetical protein